MRTIAEQEPPTKYIRNKRGRDSGKTPTCNNKCRLCHTATEDVTHVICNCPEISARYYFYTYAMTEWEKYYTFLIYKSTSLKPKSNTFKNLNI